MNAMNEKSAEQMDSAMDPILTSVLINRMDGIVREMSNTLMRAARSTVINSARDFSCSIVTADNQLFCSAEGLPVHIFGGHIQTQSMCDLHPDLKEGDAFLHNDPYMGNTHPADHTILVPVFFEGEHIFTVCAKAHQADIGNSVPTTYFAGATDVYHEGALIFPCVRVERDYETIDDFVRMCRSRIRVPDQWYGDFLASLGSARIGERRIKEMCAKYGKKVIKEFIVNWLDYSERRMVEELRSMPKSRLINSTSHDPFMGVVDEGIPVNITIDIDPESATMEVDLRDNIDSVDSGLNTSEACAISAVLCGIFNCMKSGIPANDGAFRRVKFLMRENCAIGNPTFPHSCSVATTNVADRLVNVAQSAFAQLGKGHGLAQGGIGMGMSCAVVSGRDFRRNNAPHVSQLFSGASGGAASASTDGWLNFSVSVSGGLMYQDSVELVEIKVPMLVKSLKYLPGSAAAGEYRGAPGTELVYGPVGNPMTAAIVCDGQEFPPQGVLGGHASEGARTFKILEDGTEVRLPNMVQEELKEGEWLRGQDNSGAGYGDPLDRDPERVRHDVVEKWETLARAKDIYGVAFTGNVDDESLAVDLPGTEQLRTRLRADRVASMS